MAPAENDSSQKLIPVKARDLRQGDVLKDGSIVKKTPITRGYQYLVVSILFEGRSEWICVPPGKDIELRERDHPLL